MSFSLNIWLWVIIIVCLLLIIGCFTGSFFISRKNQTTYQDEVLYPFLGFIGNGNNLIRKDGSNQISCPVGKNARILGAYFEVYDPYLECNSPNSGAVKQFQTMCQEASNTCDSKSPNTSECVCANTDPLHGYVNTVCYQGGSSNCKTRDISAYMAEKCNGKNDCDVSLEAGVAMKNATQSFGSLPCNILNTDPSYKKLPLLFGNQGVTPGQGKGDTEVNATTNQGYYIHGVFSCE